MTFNTAPTFRHTGALFGHWYAFEPFFLVASLFVHAVSCLNIRLVLRLYSLCFGLVQLLNSAGDPRVRDPLWGGGCFGLFVFVLCFYVSLFLLLDHFLILLHKKEVTKRKIGVSYPHLIHKPSRS